MDSELKHIEYLHADKSDPRPSLIPELLRACGSDGSIVSYYAQFESARIKEMAEQYPDCRSALESLLPRKMVDPLPVIREYVYDNDFKGSFSLKDVGPALLGKEASY